MQKQFKILIIGLLSILILFVIACEDDFEEMPNAPKVETISTNVINGSTVMVSGKIIENGGSALEEKGICISTSPDPAIDDLKLVESSDSDEYEVEVGELDASTEFYVRAYARNSFGIGYGSELTFTTPNGMPILESIAIDSITSISAKAHGAVIDSGGFTITKAGFCWDTLPEPDLDDSYAYDSVLTDSFSIDLTDLRFNKQYYARAFAENENGISFGEVLTFTTANGLPTVSTKNISNITAISASSGGMISNNGGYAVTNRGVCWSQQSNPTITDSHTTDGSGSGDYTSQIENLEVDKTYYVRAYATNEAGTSYGEEINFTTNNLGITITTSPITNITAISANSGGSIENNSAFDITAKGLCINTSGTPT